MTIADRIRFIYFTDFHGAIDKFDSLLVQAMSNDVGILLCGGDICPHHGQSSFLKRYFAGWLKEAAGRGIKIFGMMGNDDKAVNLSKIDEFEAEGLFNRIDMRFNELDGWTIWGYNYVPELPFGLKDWVKPDYTGAVRPLQYSKPVISTKQGYDEIKSIDDFFQKRGTIEEDLSNVKLDNPRRTILITHSPPKGCGLDVCNDRREVGSRSVLNFIEKKQPMISLHGHIHESPRVSNIWKTEIGDTIAIQPGQIPVLIDIIDNNINCTLLNY